MAAGCFAFAVVTQLLTFYLIPDGQLSDDASFLLRALKLTGQPRFADFHDPTNYAVGWPLLLVPVLKLSDQFYLAGRWVAVLLTGLSSSLLFHLFHRRQRSLVVPLTAVALFCQSVQMLRLGSSLMSEALSFFLVLLTLAICPLVHRWPGAVVLGGAVAWAVATRMENLVLVGVVLVIMLSKSRSWAPPAAFGASFFILSGLVRVLSSDFNEASHSGSVTSFFGTLSAAQLAEYPLIFVRENSLISLNSVFGAVGPLWRGLWLIPLAGAVLALRSAGFKSVLRRVAGDPLVLWAFLAPLLLFPWPYFSERYWPLWMVVVLGLGLERLPPKACLAGCLVLLILQSPSAWEQYRLGPIARRYQEELYRPYYESLSEARRVMTLSASRVETIALVPTCEPLLRTDFQSIPIGMAYLASDVIEWETSPRHLTTYAGSQARPFPVHALEGLRHSSLFEPYRRSAFGEAFRLVGDPEKLKAAGSLYSQAMQTPAPQQKLELLRQALTLVPDLPETRLEYNLLLLQLDPKSQAARTDLANLLQQYPFLKENLAGK